MEGVVDWSGEVRGARSEATGGDVVATTVYATTVLPLRHNY